MRYALKKNYGKLRQGEVYVRRGSSTDPTKPATPDEIAQMGFAAGEASPEAQLLLEFASPDSDEVLGTSIPWRAELCEMPDADQLPNLEYRKQNNPFGIDTAGLYSSLNYEELNSEYYREYWVHTFTQRLFRKVRFVLTNSGKVAANNARVELSVLPNNGVLMLPPHEMPDKPPRKRSRLNTSATHGIRPFHTPPGYIDINVGDDRHQLEMDCASIQPGRKIWSYDFFIGLTRTGKHILEAFAFAENLSEPRRFELTIDAEVSTTKMSAAQIVRLADES